MQYFFANIDFPPNFLTHSVQGTWLAEGIGYRVAVLMGKGFWLGRGLGKSGKISFRKMVVDVPPN
jgi:hypothetical protein